MSMSPGHVDDMEPQEGGSGVSESLGLEPGVQFVEELATNLEHPSKRRDPADSECWSLLTLFDSWWF